MSKTHKRVVIDFDVDEMNNNLTATLSEGTSQDLVQVLSFGGPTFTDAAINGMLNFYLRVQSRDAFLARFFSEVSKADAELLRVMHGGGPKS